MVRKCLGGLRTGISFRVLLAVAVRHPALSLRSPLQLMPLLRPPQATADFSPIVLRQSPRRKQPSPSHSSAPRFRHHVHTSHHDSSPPCLLRALGIKRCPRRSRRFRTRSSLVQLGRSCGIACRRALRRQEAAIVCFAEQTSFDFKNSSYQRLKKEAERAGWVSVVVGPGKHFSGAAISRRRSFQPQPASPRQAQSIPLPWLLRVGDR